jgi:hypothetical protein
MERARVLSNDIQWSTQRTERTAMETVTMRRAENIRSSLVNCRVNHKRRGIE